MKKTLKQLIASITAATFILVGAFTTTPQLTAFADTVTADFEIDSELWKAITEANTFDYDKNNDGVVTKEEFANNYGMQIDCQGYDIKDWSGLKNATNWRLISIKNCQGGDFSALSELTKLYEVIFIDCADFNRITGLEKIPNLTKVTVKSHTAVDINTFVPFTKLVELSVSAPVINGYENISQLDKVTKLGLSADTCQGIENFPNESIEDLSLSFKDFNDTKLKEVLAKIPYVKYLAVTDSNITSLSWVNDLERLFKLDVRNNQLRDISPLMEHKHFYDMDMYLDGNVWAPDTEDLLAKTLLELEDGSTVSTGKRVYPIDSSFNEWTCDLLDDLTFTSSSDEIVYIDSNNQIFFMCPGEVSIYVTNNKGVNMEYKYTVTGNPIEYNYLPFKAGAILGDLTGDDIVSSKDALIALMHSARIIILDEYATRIGDVNKDSIVNSIDALLILKYSAGLETEFEDDITPTPPKDTDYDNSFVISLTTNEKKVFTAEDFSSLSATNVSIVGMNKTETGYTYILIIYLDNETCTEEVLEAKMDEARQFENVTSVNYNNYCERNTILKLNYSEYEMKVGEDISLYIDDYRPYNQSSHFRFILVELNENTINESEINIETLSTYGIREYLTYPELYEKHYAWNGYPNQYDFNEDATYALFVKGGEDYTKITNALGQIPEIEKIYTYFETYPTGNRYFEEWCISNDTLASIELMGGQPIDNGSVTRVDQCATITALQPGKVIISVDKGGWGSDEKPGICEITIVE